MDGQRRLNHVELLTISEKDNQYMKQWIVDNVQKVGQNCLGVKRWIKFRDLLESLSRLGYLSMTTLANINTPGEEFCQVIDGDATNHRSLWKRIVTIALSITDETKIIPRELMMFEKLIRDVHMVTFFLFGDFYELSKRICDYNNSVRIEDSNLSSNNQLISQTSLYRLLGILTLIRMMLSNDYINPSHENALPSKKQAEEVVPADTSLTCLLCSSPRASPTSTICGHIFCWHCIHKWLKERSECPICRSPTEPSRLIYLINYR